MSEPIRAIDIIGDKEYDFDLLDDAGPTGELKSSEPSQPPLHDTFEVSGFAIRIRCTHEIHGHLNGPTSAAASLVVVKITLRSTTDDYQRFYRKFSAKFRLESDPPGDPFEEPYVIAFEPAGKGSILVTDTLAKITDGTSYEGSGGVQTNPFPMSLNMKLAKNKQEEFEQQSTYTVNADTYQTVGGEGGRQGDNIVEWNCCADPRQTIGVGDFISFAVLVHRSDEKKPLLAHLSLEATVDWRYWVANKWKNILDRKKTRYLPLRFSNKIATNLPEGIDVNHLEDAKKKLRTLGFIHVPERLAPQTFYQDV